MIEILAPIVAYLTSRENFVKFVNLYFPSLNEKTLSSLYLIPYIIVMLYLCKKPIRSNVGEDEYRDILRRKQVLSYFYSFGLMLLIDKIKEKIFRINEVELVNVFSKLPEWEEYPINHKEYPIFRFRKSGTDYEVRFLKETPNRVCYRVLDVNGNYGSFQTETLERFGYLFVLAPMQYMIQKIIG